MFHLKLTKRKVNNYNPLTRVIRSTRVIKSTIVTRWLGSYNINYYNPLIRAIEMLTIITRWLGHIIYSQTLYIINSHLQNKISYIIHFSFFINKENSPIYFPYKTHIWSMRKDKNNIFMHFKTQKKTIFFYKNMH